MQKYSFQVLTSKDSVYPLKVLRSLFCAQAQHIVALIENVAPKLPPPFLQTLLSLTGGFPNTSFFMV